MRYVINDKKYHFKSAFDTKTGAYVRTDILDENGKDTGIDPFMASFPHLIDVGVMGHCTLLNIRNLGRKSIDEIVQKIEEYKIIDEMGGLPDQESGNCEFSVPEDFDAWASEDVNKQIFVDWLKEKEIRIECLELLSARAFNLLMFAGYDYMHQIAFVSQEELMEIPRMDSASAIEIEKLSMRYIREIKDQVFEDVVAASAAASIDQEASIFDLLHMPDNHDAILQFVKANDIEIERMGLSNRPKNRLISSCYSLLSDIIFVTRPELQKIPSMGKGSIDEILEKINSYLSENESRLVAEINGDTSALWDDNAIKKMILDQYSEVGFNGLSLKDIEERLQLPEQITVEYLMESYNAILIKQGKSQAERMQLLHELAVQQMTTLSSLELSNLPGIEKK